MSNSETLSSEIILSSPTFVTSFLFFLCFQCRSCPRALWSPANPRFNVLFFLRHELLCSSSRVWRWNRVEQRAPPSTTIPATELSGCTAGPRAP